MRNREIERKFLVRSDDWRKDAKGVPCRQGYLCADENLVVRVRLLGNRAYLTIKGPKTGLSCPEYEYPLPLAEARQILERICPRPHIEKIRYTLHVRGAKWDIDEFQRENEGLVVAEVELECEDQSVELPEWVGRDISFDSKYRNVNLARNPYRTWPEAWKGA